MIDFLWHYYRNAFEYTKLGVIIGGSILLVGLWVSIATINFAMLTWVLIVGLGILSLTVIGALTVVTMFIVTTVKSSRHSRHRL